MHVFEKLGGAAIIAGSLLLSAYAVLFPILLPLGAGAFDYAEVVRSPGWVPLAWVAFAGVLALLVGFYAVYAKMRAMAGLQGVVGFLFVEALMCCRHAKRLLSSGRTVFRLFIK